MSATSLLGRLLKPHFNRSPIVLVLASHLFSVFFFFLLNIFCCEMCCRCVAATFKHDADLLIIKYENCFFARRHIPRWSRGAGAGQTGAGRRSHSATEGAVQERGSGRTGDVDNRVDNDDVRGGERMSRCEVRTSLEATTSCVGLVVDMSEHINYI